MDPGLVKFVEYLTRNRVRATYAALAEAADVSQRSVGKLLGARAPLASWVVNAATGEPTGYASHQKDPHLHDSDEVIVSGAELVRRMKRESRDRNGVAKMPEAVQVLQNYHRLFLYVPEDSRFQFRLRVVADAGQAGARSAPTAVISSRTMEPLELCLRELGVTGYSRYLDDTRDGPAFEYRESPVDDILKALTQRPLATVAHVTLIASNSSAEEMRQRIVALRAKVGESVSFEGLA